MLSWITKHSRRRTKTRTVLWKENKCSGEKWRGGGRAEKQTSVTDSFTELHIGRIPKDKKKKKNKTKKKTECSHH